MRYGKSSLWNRFISSKITLVCLLIVLFVLVRATWNISRKSSLSAARLAQANIELGKLEDRQKELSSRIDYLSTEQGIESELRTKFRAVKEGESVAVIVDKSQQQTAAAGSVSPNVPVVPEEIGWFGKLLRWIGM